MPPPSPSDAALPGHDVEIAEPLEWGEVTSPAPREVPRDGRGMLTVGTFAALAGATLFVGSAVLASKHVAVDYWGPSLVLGAGATLASSLLLWGGRRRLLRYREWEAAQRPDLVPRQGHALVASGAVLLIGGAASGMSGTVMWMIYGYSFAGPDPRVPPISPAMVGLGVGSLAIGSVLMIVGMKRHKQFQAWRSRPLPIPVISPLPSGAQIGLSGRF